MAAEHPRGGFVINKRIALIDGDIFAHESACKAESKLDFGDGDPIVHSDFDHALANFDARVRTAMNACGATDCIIALSCPTRRYFRHDLYPQYKSNRTGPRPLALVGVREHAHARYRVITKPTLEADDVLGVLATWAEFREKNGEPVIVTSDKDLNQIPGLHLNHNKLDAGVYEVTRDQGDYFHLYQTLVGDRTDGYPGCPGVGPKKAEKVLRDLMPRDAWNVVVSTFVGRGKTEDDALLQARLARIVQADDWDFVASTVRLWQPSIKETASK